MIQFKKLDGASANQIGYAVIFLWVFCVTLSFNIVRGDHITFGFSVGPFEISLGFSIWRKLLP